MRILKPSWAHERTLEYFDPPTPEETLLPTFKGRRDVVTRTARGLGGGTRLTSSDPTSGAEQRWIALVEHGLVDLDAIPVLLRRPEQAGSPRCDEVERYVVARVESGATVRALIGGAYAVKEVVRAMARLNSRGLLQLG